MDEATHIWRIYAGDNLEYLVRFNYEYPNGAESRVTVIGYRCTEHCTFTTSTHSHNYGGMIPWDTRGDQYEARNDALTPINNSVQILLEVT